MLAAIHRAVDPGSKNEFRSWFEQTTLPSQLNIKNQAMTSQHFWDQMDEITEENLRDAEDAIIAKVLEKYPTSMERLALDYTNYFTYISTGNDACTLAQRGKNKQKRHDLRQCSLAIVTAKDLGIPLFSHVYEGNHNDQTEFGEYVQLLKERLPNYDPQKITLVFDGGSNTKKNLNSLETHYICAFSLTSCKELYQIPLESYETIILKKGKKEQAYRTEKTIWGKECTCILTLSPALYAGQERELKQDRKKTLEELKTLNEQIKNPKSRIKKTEESLTKRVEKILKRKHMREIIQIQITEAGLTYEADVQKEADIKKQYFGKKLHITDHKDWSTEDILEAYYEQDSIEKIFRSSKDPEHSPFQPIYHWTDQKIRTHIFICLLGLTMTIVLQKEAEKRGIKISQNRLLEELIGIRESWIKEDDSTTGKVVRKLEKMSDMQEKLWEMVQEL
ncbi:MAG: IS1634 family transposase [Peptococcaceae bacterium]|nr:IS1634 family transposase [Peptococcaceae bacterium]